MQVPGRYGYRLALFIAAGVIVDSMPKRPVYDTAEPAYRPSTHDNPKHGEKAESTALIVYGDMVDTLKRKHSDRVITHALSATKDGGDATATPVPMPSLTEKPVNWEIMQKGAERGIRAFQKAYHLIKEPNAKNAIELVKTIVEVVSAFLPEISPFSTVIFGVIDMFMPSEVRIPVLS